MENLNSMCKDGGRIGRLIAEGASNRAIGEALGIPTGTVATRLWRLFAKLEVSGRSGFVARYVTEAAAVYVGKLGRPDVAEALRRGDHLREAHAD